MATANPFHLPLKQKPLATVASSMLGLTPLAAAYDRKPASATAGLPFLQYTLDALDVSLSVDGDAELAAIPRQGATLLVANHPLGGLEGVAIARKLLEVRPDLKVMTNALLRRIPELAELFIGLDILSANASRVNAAGIREAHRHLEQGGCLLIFPAGMVSAYDVKSRRIHDRQWHRLAGQLLRRQNATCVPLYVHGRNSALFYAAGLVHPRLRTLMLARELANKRGKTLRLTVGQPIAPVDWQHLDSDEAITHYLRISTDMLSHSNRTASVISKAYAPLREPVAVEQLAAAVAGMQEYLLLEQAEFQVYCAPRTAMGPVMDQLGLMREETFRAAGEGTGSAADIDHYDDYYLHLFIWDREKNTVVGGYRIGLIDEIVREHGIQGLYSRTLYRFDKAFVSRLGAAIEMGRSFIHPDYQRRPTALDLLWRGIGAFLVNNPTYNTLFGPVSISRDYSDIARALIADTMVGHFSDDRFHGSVRPLRPLKVARRFWTAEMLASLANIKVLNKLVGRSDPGKSIPVLLRHYLSLNGRFVCFNVDPEFNNTLAGLIVVDLRTTPAKYLKRYMGDEGAKQFMNAQRLECAS